MLNAIHYETCDVYVATEEQYTNDDWEEIFEDEDLFDMLTDLDAEGVEYILANYCHVEWNFYDRGAYQFRIEYDVEEDSIHISYDNFNLKTKYTLINILKSQSEWHHIGIVIFDGDTEEAVDGSWFDASETKNDIWIHEYEELCDEYAVNTKCAYLFKGQEEEDGKTMDILDLVIVAEIQPKAK